MKMKVDQNLISEIKKLKKEKNAIILGHYYQIPEIQDISDFIGDSLALSQKAQSTDADIILFCGVHFMAETAKILSPDKKVIIPDLEAGCSLAESCPAGEFSKFVNARPKHTVISYINCTAEVKALSDIICTSSNAVGIINSLPEEENIIFAPDKNLGAYINNLTGRNMVLWNGTCEVHDILSVERVLTLKEKHPEAKLIAHPECKAQILAMADFVGSTTALLNFTRRDPANEFIVATESGIIHQMKKYNPDKSFIIVPTDESCMCNDCPHMKLNTMDKVYNCLLNEKFEITLDENVIEKARKPIIRMLELSEKIGL
jgi:quinolinate synthase